MTDPLKGLFDFVGNLFYPQDQQTQKGPDVLLDLFKVMPDGGAAWANAFKPRPTPYPWDPSQEEFWAQVRANQADAKTPERGSFQETVRNATTRVPEPLIDKSGQLNLVYPKEAPYGAQPAGPAPSTRNTWTSVDPRWNGLNSYEKAAAMALLEADKADPENAKNALAAMLNRSAKERVELGLHVSSRKYQPSFEPAQQARLASILAKPAFKELTTWAQRYDRGEEKDPVNGATHFLAHANVMLALEAREPGKYRSWRGWSKFDPATGQYGNFRFKDRSHSFLSPEGAFTLSRVTEEPNG